MRIIIILVSLISVFCCSQQETRWTQDLREVRMKMDFPNKDWYLDTKWGMRPPLNRYVFRWNSNEDSDEKNAEISVSIEDIDTTADALTFLSTTRTRDQLDRIEEIV